jgi:hypothetical protein
MSPLIEYDVSHVLPFPLKDPEIEGMKRGKRRHGKPQVELPDGLERFRFYTVEELGEFPPVSWLIDGYLAVGELTIFYGPGDTYKSFVALDWSCELARQGDFVVYIVSEGASGIRARIAAWQKHHAVSDLPSLLLMPSNVNLQKPGEAENWLEAAELQLRGRQPVLVVVDTLARNFVGGNENSAEDMGMFVDGAERIRRELRTAVLPLHHTTKDGKSERGTEALRNASFAMFEFTRKNETTVDVRCDRMKDAERPEERRLVPVKVPLPELGEGVSSLVAGWAYSPGAKGRVPGESPAEISPEQRRLLRVLIRGNRRAKGATPAELWKDLGVSQTTFNYRAKPLVESGLLRTEGRTRSTRYFITETGSEALE